MKYFGYQKLVLLVGDQSLVGRLTLYNIKSSYSKSEICTVL